VQKGKGKGSDNVPHERFITLAYAISVSKRVAVKEGKLSLKTLGLTGELEKRDYSHPASEIMTADAGCGWEGM